VAGCSSFVNRISRYCARHRDNDQRYGHPLGRAIRKSETGRFSRILASFIKANRNHPALTLVFTELDTMVAEGTARAAATPNAKLAPHDWRPRLDRELSRLHRHGVTPADIFREVGTLWFYSRTYSRELPPLSRRFHFAAARAVLSLAPREGRWSLDGRHKQATRRHSTLVLEHFGRSLTVALAGVLRAAEASFDQHANTIAQRHRSLRAALEQPFT